MSLWFVVPAHGRKELAGICLRQLRRTCDALTEEGIEATAVVIACDENLDTARSLGFGTVERDNTFLSRKFNDGIQFALDEEFNPRPADYVVPCGSDDWVDHRIFLELPEPGSVLGFQRLSFVSPDGSQIAHTRLDYPGGCGIRVYPRQVLEPYFRPADEDRYRACDTSILTNTQRVRRGLKLVYREIDPRQIVDWKSPSEQVTEYKNIIRRHHSVLLPDPFDVLEGVFPADALSEMEVLYASRSELVAA